MYGNDFVKLRDNIESQLVDNANSLLVFQDTGMIPDGKIYSKLAIGCIVKDCITIMNDVCIDFNKTTKLLYNNLVTT